MPVYRAVIDLAFPVGSGGGTNTWHIRTATAADLGPDDVNVIMGWIRQFYTSAAPIVPTDWVASWDGTVQEILTTEPTQATGTAWSVPGGAATGLFSAAAGMACVTWRTTLSSRSGRGRTFLGPLAVGSVGSDGTLSATALGFLREAADALVSSSNTNNNVGAVTVFSPTDALARDIVASSVTDQVAVLRSRRS